MDCIFCKIVERIIPAYIFYEDEHTLGILNISPTSKGHSLIIPKRHARNLLDMSVQEIADLSKALDLVPKKIREVVKADGVNIISNNEEAAGQEIFHTHIHIVPRFKNDGLQEWPHKDADPKSLTKLVEKLKV